MSVLYTVARTINTVHFVFGLLIANIYMVSTLMKRPCDAQRSVSICISTQLCSALYGFAVRAAIHHKRTYLIFMTVIGVLSAVLYSFLPFVEDMPAFDDLKDFGPFSPFYLMFSIILLGFQVIQIYLIKKGHPYDHQRCPDRNLVDEEKLVGPI